MRINTRRISDRLGTRNWALRRRTRKRSSALGPRSLLAQRLAESRQRTEVLVRLHQGPKAGLVVRLRKVEDHPGKLHERSIRTTGGFGIIVRAVGVSAVGVAISRRRRKAMQLTKLMVAGAAVCGSLVLMVPVSVRGHDISQDSHYKSSDDTTHTCHHKRVFYWRTLSEVADGKVGLLRYHHAGEQEGQPEAEFMADVRKRLADARKRQMRANDQSVRAAERLLSAIEEGAKIIGCYPWP